MIYSLSVKALSHQFHGIDGKAIDDVCNNSSYIKLTQLSIKETLNFEENL